MKYLFCMLMLLAARIAAQPAAPEVPHEAAKPGFALIELFTSEGCSSCPPAEQNLKAIYEQAQQQGRRVIPLAFHVDYWDYLGWKDPYANAEYTARQRAYAQKFQGDGLYTPQAVVNGKWQAPGSNRKLVEAMTARALAEPEVHSLSITASRITNLQLQVMYDIPQALVKNGSILQLAVVEKMEKHYVSRGENQGRELEHTYVVRHLESIDLRTLPAQKGGGVMSEINLPIAGDINPALLGLVAYVQDAQTLHVLAAQDVMVPFE